MGENMEEKNKIYVEESKVTPELLDKIDAINDIVDKLHETMATYEKVQKAFETVSTSSVAKQEHSKKADELAKACKEFDDYLASLDTKLENIDKRRILRRAFIRYKIASTEKQAQQSRQTCFNERELRDKAEIEVQEAGKIIKANEHPIDIYLKYNGLVNDFNKVLVEIANLTGYQSIVIISNTTPQNFINKFEVKPTQDVCEIYEGEVHE